MSAGVPRAASRSRATVSGTGTKLSVLIEEGSKKSARLVARSAIRRAKGPDLRRAEETISTRGEPLAAAAAKARAPSLFLSANSTPSICLQVPKTVDAMVGAAAGIGPVFEIANLHFIETAAARSGRETSHTGPSFGSSASIFAISVRPRQRRSSISSESLVFQPRIGGFCRTLRALLGFLAMVKPIANRGTAGEEVDEKPRRWREHQGLTQGISLESARQIRLVEGGVGEALQHGPGRARRRPLRQLGMPAAIVS